MTRTLVVVALLACAGLWALAPVQAADPPLFQKGQAIIVAWDCVPEWVPQVAAQALGTDTLGACYAEPLIVQVVRKDGWLEVSDPRDGARWRVNPARMTGFTVAERGQRAD